MINKMRPLRIIAVVFIRTKIQFMMVDSVDDSLPKENPLLSSLQSNDIYSNDSDPALLDWIYV